MLTVQRRTVVDIETAISSVQTVMDIVEDNYGWNEDWVSLDKAMTHLVAARELCMKG